MKNKFEGARPIAMLCNEKQFYEILPKLLHLGFKEPIRNPYRTFRVMGPLLYLVNNNVGVMGYLELWGAAGASANCPRDVFQKWNKEVFLEYCTIKPNNMSELKVSKEKVLEAASKCSNAKEILKTLFPEVFVEDKSVDLVKLRDSGSKESVPSILGIRNHGKWKGKVFYLHSYYNWEIKVDIHGELCLVPTKK